MQGCTESLACSQILVQFCSGRELAKWLRIKCCKFISFFTSLNFHMHISNMSVTYVQSIKRIHWKLSEELISQKMRN